MTTPSATLTRPAKVWPSVRQHIHDLAAKHGVTYAQTPMDRLADVMAAMSDSAVELDETEKLITALERAGVITRDEGADLHDSYVRGDLGLD